MILLTKFISRSTAFSLLIFWVFIFILRYWDSSYIIWLKFIISHSYKRVFNVSIKMYLLQTSFSSSTEKRAPLRKKWNGTILYLYEQSAVRILYMSWLLIIKYRKPYWNLCLDSIKLFALLKIFKIIQLQYQIMTSTINAFSNIFFSKLSGIDDWLMRSELTSCRQSNDLFIWGA